LEERSNSGESVGESFFKGLDDSNSSLSVKGIFIETGGSFGTPGLEVVNDEKEVRIVVEVSLSGDTEGFDDFFGGGDEGVKSANFVLERSSLFVEVGFKGFPIGLGLGFSLSFTFLSSLEGVSDGLEEIEDSDDLLVVEFGGDGGEGGEEGLEEGSVSGVVSEGFFNLDVSFSDLGERNTVDQVLDELGGFFEGGNSFGVFEVSIGPGGVFRGSLGSSGFEGVVGFIQIGGGLVKGKLSLGEDFSVVLDGVVETFKGGDDIGVLGFEGSVGFFAEVVFGFVEAVSGGLVGFEVTEDGVKETIEFRNVGGGLEGHFDGREEGGSESVLLHLSKFDMGVDGGLGGVFGGADGDQQSNNDELVHF
jgi:hypothetical protein